VQNREGASWFGKTTVKSASLQESVSLPVNQDLEQTWPSERNPVRKVTDNTRSWKIIEGDRSIPQMGEAGI
jgi:hypothetical protein